MIRPSRVKNRNTWTIRPQVEQLEDRIVPCIDPLTGLSDGDHDGDAVVGSPAIGTFPAIVSPGGSSGGTTSGSTSASPIPVPAYNSLPGAGSTLYLNFGGDTVSSWLGYSPGTIPAYSIDSDTSTFSAQELANIYDIWKIVAENYSPFNINVTTVAPAGSTQRVSQMDIGGNGSWTGGSYGGIAQVGGITSGTGSNPVRGFVFPNNLGNGAVWYTAAATSHEAGHNMGLSHQSTWSGGTKTAEYQQGPGDGTAPIIGVSYYASREMWWYGTNSNNNYQNDMAVIAGAVGYRADEAGGTAGTAAPLTVAGNTVSASGVITSMTELDDWSFTTNAGTVSFTVSALNYDGSHYSNLTPKIELLDANGNVVVGWQDPNTWTVSWSGTLAAGSYRLVVSSHGVYSSAQTSTNYGFDVGSYTISGSILTPAGFVAAPSNLIAAASGSSQINLSWTDNATNETGYTVERSTDGTNFTQIGSLGANSTSYADTGLTAGATYYYRVRAWNGSTPSDYSNQASATLSVPPPPAPGSLAAAMVTSTRIHLSWTDSSNNETGFAIERAAYNKGGKLGGWTQIATVGANVIGYDDNSVVGTKFYNYRIRSYNSGGYSAYTYASNPKVAGGSALGGQLFGQSASDFISGLTWLSAGSAADSTANSSPTYAADFSHLDKLGTDRAADHYLAAGLNSATGPKLKSSLPGGGFTDLLGDDLLSAENQYWVSF